MVSVQVCASSLASATAADQGSCASIELCASLEVGGLTPSLGLIKAVSSRVDTPIHVLIRPRSGGFVYSKDEIEIIKNDIAAIGKSEAGHVAGIVVGVLNAKQEVDVPIMTELVNLASHHGLSVTFHRAFDDVADWSKGLEDVIKTGCARLLTSGGGQSCVEPESKARLRSLRKQAQGRIYIMAGGGVTEDNAMSLITATNVEEVHASCKAVISKDMQEKSLFATDRFETNKDSVRRLLKVCSGLGGHPSDQ